MSSMPIARACVLFHAGRRCSPYEKLRELANQCRRFGYRRLPILLCREGIMINCKKTERLYEEGLAVRRRRSRKRAFGTRASARCSPCRTNAVAWISCMTKWRRVIASGFSTWSMTRQCLAAVLDISIYGCRAVRELTILIAQRGKSRMIVSDNGTELTSNAVLAWCGKVQVEWYYIASSRPM